MHKHRPQKPALALGTAQFGSPYGIGNRRGQIPEQEIGAILHAASSAGFTYLDTAPSYGAAEEIIGRHLRGHHHLAVITKTAPCRSEVLTAADLDRIRESLYRSLDRLQVESAYALLVHQPEDLQKPVGKRLAEMLYRFRQDGLIQRVGLSIYDSDQLEQAQHVLKPEIVQLPLNLFDQRLLSDGVIEQLCHAGVEVHVRSVFLQGVILMLSEHLPAHLAGLSAHLERLGAATAAHGLTPLQAALGFVLDQKHVAAAVVGVASLTELNQVIDAARSEYCHTDMSEFAVSESELIDPRRWATAPVVTAEEKV